MNYQTSLPYFHSEDIEEIISKVKKILSGEGMLTKGPLVKEFENKYSNYVGSKFGVSTNSCTTALEIVLKSINLNKDDEVIVPTQTFVSTGSCVLNAGGKVIFCDTDNNFSLDFNDLKLKISKKTKAVIVVHFAGLIQENILEIKKYLNERNIFLIEDCAHSSGAKINGLISGNIGDFGCHSFYSTKIMTTGEGGMITTNHEEYFLKCSSIRSIGIDVKSKSEVFNNLGTNNRMAEFEAILGLSQLKRLDEFVDHRIKVANSYMSELRNLENNGLISFQKFSKNIKHPFWKFIVFLNSDRISVNDLKDELLKNGVNISAPYNPLMHLQPLFNDNNIKLKNADNLSKYHFCLPIHFKITINDTVIISNLLKKALKW